MKKKNGIQENSHHQSLINRLKPCSSFWRKNNFFKKLSVPLLIKSINRKCWVNLPKFLIAIMCLATLKADALEITVDNQTDADAAMAFSYLDKDKNVWMSEGWFNVHKHQNKKLELNTDNSLYYIYAEFSNGKKIEGGEGSVLLEVSDRSFLCDQDKGPEGKLRKVSFLRARSNEGKALIRVK